MGPRVRRGPLRRKEGGSKSQSRTWDPLLHHTSPRTSGPLPGSLPAGVAPAPPGGWGKTRSWVLSQAGGQRLARLAPSRPRGNPRDPHPGSPGRRAGRAGAGQALPPTSSSWNLGTALRGGGAGAQGPGARAWRPLSPTPLSSPRSTAHPGTPGRSGTFPSRAGGVLSRWRGRVRGARLPGVQAATHRPRPPRTRRPARPAPPGRGATAAAAAASSSSQRASSPRRGRPAGSRPLSLS